MDNFSDTLIALGEKKNSRIILELSPKEEKIPEFIKEKYQSAGAVLFAFCKEIIDAAADFVPAVMIDKSAFEIYGAGGMMACDTAAKYAHKKGLIVIIDGCFGGTENALDNYVDAYLTSEGAESDELFADAITVSPFATAASLKNAAAYVASSGKALFMYLRTTKSADKTNFENIVTKDEEEPLFFSAADDAAAFGENYIGEKGYSALGMLTFASKDAAKIRRMNKWGLALTRIDLSELGDTSYYGYFYKGEGEGQFMVLGDDVVYAYSEAGAAPEAFAEACAAAVESAAKTVEKYRRG